MSATFRSALRVHKSLHAATSRLKSRCSSTSSAWASARFQPPSDTNESTPPTLGSKNEPSEAETDQESSSLPRNTKTTSERKKKRLKKLKKDPIVKRNPLEPTKVDLHLASLSATGVEPTLEDIERCKPPRIHRSLSPEYSEEYNALLDTLCRSFSKDQLRRFAALYNVESRSSLRKIEYVESIIEKQWKWPSLRAVERERRDRTEVSATSFPVSASELFLLLGNDGADLLQMSLEYNVHISLTPSPLALKVEGLRQSLHGLTEHIGNVKKGIVEEIVDLPSTRTISPEFAQRISRLAGAFIENFSSGKVRICAKDSQMLLAARRLVIRAVCDLEESNSIQVLSYSPAELPEMAPVATSIYPNSYSLYPFLPPRSLPWTMHAGGAFRIRRVGEWLGDESEKVQRTGGLAKGRGRITTLSGEPFDLKDFLFRHRIGGFAQSSTKISRVVTASTGHLLVTSPVSAQRATIVPPLKGYWPFVKIAKWMQNSAINPIFVPSLPAVLLSAQRSQQKVLHRLVYHARRENSPQHFSEKPASLDSGMKTIKLDIAVSDHNALTSSKSLVEEEPSQMYDAQTEEHPSDHQPSAPAPTASTSHHCYFGLESKLNLMMPDRPMDICFGAWDSYTLSPDEEPQELREYVTSVQEFLTSPETKQPTPPLSLLYQGDNFILQTNASIRQSVETIASSPSDDHTLEGSSVRQQYQATSESIFDLESKQKSSIHQVILRDENSEVAWEDFLTACDNLTSKKISGRLGYSLDFDLDVDQSLEQS